MCDYYSQTLLLDDVLINPAQIPWISRGVYHSMLGAIKTLQARVPTFTDSLENAHFQAEMYSALRGLSNFDHHALLSRRIIRFEGISAFSCLIPELYKF